MCDDENVEIIDDQVVPPVQYTFKLFLADLLNNIGSTVEQLAAIPHDIALRINGHIKWRERGGLTAREARRTIERVEAYSNENRRR